MENLGLAELKENPLEEERKAAQDFSEVVDKELPPLEAKARVRELMRGESSVRPAERFFLFPLFLFFRPFTSPCPAASLTPSSSVHVQWRLDVLGVSEAVSMVS